MVKKDDLPTEREVMHCLLFALPANGAAISAQQAYRLLAEHFSLTARQVNQVIGTVNRESHWHNRVRQAKRKLVDKGYVDNSERDKWCLTEKGQDYRRDLDILGLDI